MPRPGDSGVQTIGRFCRDEVTGEFLQLKTTYAPGHPGHSQATLVHAKYEIDGVRSQLFMRCDPSILQHAAKSAQDFVRSSVVCVLSSHRRSCRMCSPSACGCHLPLVVPKTPGNSGSLNFSNFSDHAAKYGGEYFGTSSILTRHRVDAPYQKPWGGPTSVVNSCASGSSSQMKLSWLRQMAIQSRMLVGMAADLPRSVVPPGSPLIPHDLLNICISAPVSKGVDELHVGPSSGRLQHEGGGSGSRCCATADGTARILPQGRTTKDVTVNNIEAQQMSLSCDQHGPEFDPSCAADGEKENLSFFDRSLVGTEVALSSPSRAPNFSDIESYFPGVDFSGNGGRSGQTAPHFNPVSTKSLNVCHNTEVEELHSALGQGSPREDRKRRNRESAWRSNQRRKAYRAKLAKDLSDIRIKKDELLSKKATLQSVNLALKERAAREWMATAKTPSHTENYESLGNAVQSSEV